MSNAQKKPLVQSLSEYNRTFINDSNELDGKNLPCHVVAVTGSIVTVQFDILPGNFNIPEVTIPVYGFEYIRYPIKIGDKGNTVSASVSLRGVSGLGSGMADLSAPPSLTALFFMPISNANWSAVDPNAVTLYAPNGVVLRDEASATTFVLTPTSIAAVSPGAISATVGGTSVHLTPTTLSLNGTSLTLTDSAATTSPETMNTAWAALVTWLNGHTHSDDGSGPPSTPFSGGSIAP